MYKKIASNTIAQVLSKAATAVISIFLISILTNFLSIELYGLYSKIYNYIGIFVFLADLGLYAITIREITANKKDSSKIVGNVMSLRLIMGILILFLATGIAYFIPGYDSLLALYSIIIASIFTIVQLINSSILALMQAYMKIEFSLISTVVSKLVNIGLIAAIAYYYTAHPGEGFFIPFLAIMTVGVIWVSINTIMNYLYARKICKINFAFDLDYIKHIFKISLPYGIALFLSIVYFKVDLIILSIMEGPKMGDLSIALYSLPMKIIEVLMVVGGFYLSSILPTLTKFFKEKNEAGLSHLLDVSFKILFGFSSIIFVMGIIFREYIIEIIANRDYLDTTHLYNSADAFLVVFAVVIVYFISLIFIYTLIASNNQSKLLKINIVVTLINIIGNIILIPKFSFMGAGLVTLFSQFALLGFTYLSCRGLIKYVPSFGYIIRVIAGGAIVYYFTQSLLVNHSLGFYGDFFVYGTVGTLLYCLLLSYDFMQLKSNEST